MPLAEAIRDLRKSKGLTQTQLAVLIGVTQPFVTQLENGSVSDLKSSTLYRLCDALGVPCDHFRPFLATATESEPEPEKPRAKPKK